MDYDKLEKLVEKGLDLPYGLERTALMEEAVAMADGANDIYSAVFARGHLVESATFGGAGEKALTAFSWVLAAFDKDPECSEPYQVLWQYKWIYNSIYRYPSISLEKIRQVGADIRRRFVDHGYQLGVIDSMDALCFQFLGMTEKVDESYRKWVQAPRDDMSDCEACDHNTRIELMNLTGRFSDAVETSKRIIQQDLSCAEVPQLTYAELLYPLSKLGQLELAMEYQQTGYSLSRGKPGLIFANANHLQFLVHSNDLEKAKECFLDHLQVGLQQKIPHKKLVFLVASEGFLRKAKQDRPKLFSSLKLPQSVLEEVQDSKELCPWIRSQSKDLINQFDKRNGNTHLSEFFQMKLDWMLE